MKTPQKTTILGVAAIVQALAVAVMAFFDGNDATAVDWQGTMTIITLSIAAIFARDNKVSDQQAGARPEPGQFG